MRSRVCSRFMSPAALLLAFALVGCGQQSGPSAAGVAKCERPAGLCDGNRTAGLYRPGRNERPRGYRGFHAFGCLDHVHDGGSPADLRPSGRVERGGPGGRASARAVAPLPRSPTLRGNRWPRSGPRMATGSTCVDQYPYAVLDSQDLTALTLKGATPRFVFETRGNV